MVSLKRISMLLMMVIFCAAFPVFCAAENRNEGAELTSYEDLFTEPAEYRIDLGASEGAVFSNAYEAYYNVVIRCIEQYGDTDLVDGFNNGQQHFTGLSFLDMVDFNHDGTDELLLVFYVQDQGYVTNIWGYDGEKAVLLRDPAGGRYGLNGTVVNIYLVDNAYGTFLLAGSADEFLHNYYYGYAGAEFGLVKYLDNNEFGYNINGEASSPEQWNAELAFWGTRETAREEYQLCPYETAEGTKTWAITAETVEKLKQAGENAGSGTANAADNGEGGASSAVAESGTANAADNGEGGASSAVAGSGTANAADNGEGSASKVVFSYEPIVSSIGDLFMYMVDENNQLILQVDESKGGKAEVPLFVEGFDYRPWPIEETGGLNSRVLVEQLPDNRVLTEVIYGVIAAGLNYPRVEAYYTVYSLDTTYGMIQEFQGIRVLFCEGNGNPAPYEQFYLNDAACTWADIEAALGAYNIHYYEREIQIGVGGPAFFAEFYEADAGGEELLDLWTEVQSELPPTKEALQQFYAPAYPADESSPEAETQQGVEFDIF